jgi:hypothetical protein
VGRAKAPSGHRTQASQRRTEERGRSGAGRELRTAGAEAVLATGGWQERWRNKTQAGLTARASRDGNKASRLRANHCTRCRRPAAGAVWASRGRRVMGTPSCFSMPLSRRAASARWGETPARRRETRHSRPCGQRGRPRHLPGTLVWRRGVAVCAAAGLAPRSTINTAEYASCRRRMPPAVPAETLRIGMVRCIT